MWRWLFAATLFAMLPQAATAGDLCASLKGMTAAAAGDASALRRLPPDFDCQASATLRCRLRPSPERQFVRLLRSTGECFGTGQFAMTYPVANGREVATATFEVPGARVVLRNLDPNKGLFEIEVASSRAAGVLRTAAATDQANLRQVHCTVRNPELDVTFSYDFLIGPGVWREWEKGDWGPNRCRDASECTVRGNQFHAEPQGYMLSLDLGSGAATYGEIMSANARGSCRRTSGTPRG